MEKILLVAGADVRMSEYKDAIHMINTVTGWDVRIRRLVCDSRMCKPDFMTLYGIFVGCSEQHNTTGEEMNYWSHSRVLIHDAGSRIGANTNWRWRRSSSKGGSRTWSEEAIKPGKTKNKDATHDPLVNLPQRPSLLISQPIPSIYNPVSLFCHSPSLSHLSLLDSLFSF